MAVVEMLVCSICTNTTDLFVVPRLPSLVLGSVFCVWLATPSQGAKSIIINQSASGCVRNFLNLCLT